MNSKLAKHARKMVRAIRKKDPAERTYEDSTHPKEKPHVKHIPVKSKEYTKAGFKDVVKYYPMKVGTSKLTPGCGRRSYKTVKNLLT